MGNENSTSLASLMSEKFTFKIRRTGITFLLSRPKANVIREIRQKIKGWQRDIEGKESKSESESELDIEPTIEFMIYVVIACLPDLFGPDDTDKAEEFIAALGSDRLEFTKRCYELCGLQLDSDDEETADLFTSPGRLAEGR